MAMTNTTLSSSVSASELFFPVTTTTSGFPGVGVIGSKQIMRVDGEDMLIDVVPVSGTVKVMQRGFNGTRAVAHDTNAAVMTSSDPQDFGNPPTYSGINRPEWTQAIASIGQDVTFTAAGTGVVAGTSMPIPTRDTTYHIDKASACAIVLISATSAQAGIKLTFVNQVAAANTIAYTPGFLGNTTSSDVATSSALVGATFVIQCGRTGLWAPLNTGTGTGWTLG